MNYYQNKYLKYKNKYLILKNQKGSALSNMPTRTLEEEDFNCRICLIELGNNLEEINETEVARCENWHLFHIDCVRAWCSTLNEQHRYCRCPFNCGSNNFISPIIRQDGQDNILDIRYFDNQGC